MGNTTRPDHTAGRQAEPWVLIGPPRALVARRGRCQCDAFIGGSGFWWRRIPGAKPWNSSFLGCRPLICRHVEGGSRAVGPPCSPSSCSPPHLPATCDMSSYSPSPSSVRPAGIALSSKFPSTCLFPTPARGLVACLRSGWRGSCRSRPKPSPWRETACPPSGRGLKGGSGEHVSNGYVAGQPTWRHISRGGEPRNACTSRLALDNCWPCI